MGTRKAATRLGLLSLLIACILTAVAIAAPAARAASITVNIRSQDSQAPLAGIRVNLYRQLSYGWDQAGEATSSGLPGDVQFWGLPAGTYTLLLRDASGTYPACYWDQAFTRFEATRIVLADETVYSADVELPLAGRIAGVVTDESGTPLKGIYVYAGNGHDSDGQGADALTAADGSYAIGGLLPAKNWVLYLEDQEYEAYIYEFWSGARVPEDATPVSVSSGQTTTIDVAMRKSATISGVITTRLGLPCQNVLAAAYARTPSGGWVDFSGVSCDVDGSFTICHLPPGRYSVAFFSAHALERKRYYPGTALRSEAKVFTLGYGEAVDLREVVWNDTNRPTPEAPEAETVVRGRTANVLYRVRDKRPGGPTADVTIKVATRRGKLVKTVVLPRRKVNRWLSGRFACDLPRGSYTFTVYAVDLGGNRQTRPAVNTLRVR